MFDKVISRDATHAYKWQKYQHTDILPAWVADADYACPTPLLDGLKSYLDNQILGYTLPQHYSPASEAVVRWLMRQYQWDIKPEWIVWTPGVVPAFNMACRAFSPSGGKIIVAEPNYPPLLAAPELNACQRLPLPTQWQADRETIDFDALEQLASEPSCQLMILCNPMNPQGTVLSRQELTAVADICERHKVILCSDEIHCDLILDTELQHVPAGKIPALAERSVTLMAASKTFNIAGLGASFAIIPCPKLRAKFKSAGAGIVPWVNILGLVATELAFTQCDQWYSELLPFLARNRDFLSAQLNNIEGLEYQPAAATFLAWVDCHKLALADPSLWFEARGVGPSPGREFGDSQFVRINFAMPYQQLELLTERLKR